MLGGGGFSSSCIIAVNSFLYLFRGIFNVNDHWMNIIHFYIIQIQVNLMLCRRHKSTRTLHQSLASNFTIFIRDRWSNLLVIKEEHHFTAAKWEAIERHQRRHCTCIPETRIESFETFGAPRMFTLSYIFYALMSFLTIYRSVHKLITRRVRHIAINDGNIRKLSDEIVILCVQSWIKVFHYIICLFVHIALLSLFVPFILLYTFNISLDYDADKFLFKYDIIIFLSAPAKSFWQQQNAFLDHQCISLCIETSKQHAVSQGKIYDRIVFMLRCPEFSHKRVIEFNALRSLYFIVAFVFVDWLAWKSWSCILDLWSIISLYRLNRITFLDNKCRS